MVKDQFQKFVEDVNTFISLKREAAIKRTVEISKLGTGVKRDAQDIWHWENVKKEVRTGVIKLLNRYF